MQQEHTIIHVSPLIVYIRKNTLYDKYKRLGYYVAYYLLLYAWLYFISEIIK